MRRKGEVRLPTRLRQYPYRATMQVDYHRTLAEQEAVSAAATSISGGDYYSESARHIESGVAWGFRTSAEAHAMQVWLEGHVRPYDPWSDGQRSHESNLRWRRQCADLINAAAAVGALERILRTPHDKRAHRRAARD